MKFCKILFCLLALIPVAACQAEEPEYQAGVHYEVLPQPVPTNDPAKVEVVEVFWYGCHHCYNFEPLISNWKKDLPAYVQFVPVPAVWHPDMSLHAQAYYAARALKVLDPMHTKLFEALNLDRKSLRSESEIADLFEDNGVNRDKFIKMFNSFGVTQSVKVGESRQRAYRIKGTPELIVNGKYRISARMAGSQAKMLEVADYLVALERAEMQ